MTLRPMAVFAALLGAGGLAAQDLPDWVLQLSRIKRQARANFEKLPNYACLETIQRFDAPPRRPGTLPLVPGYQHLDTMRFEVAVIGRQELFAKAGADRFDEKDPTKFISAGAMSTGEFSGLVSNLFVHDNGRITAHGEESAEGRTVLWFQFEMPESVAGLTVSTIRGSASVGVRGVFRADAETLDLLEIEEEGTGLPPFLGVAETYTDIHYSRMRIGASEILLPDRAEMVIAETSGRRTRNVTEFSRCRQYGSESVIHFADEPEPPPPAKKK